MLSIVRKTVSAFGDRKPGSLRWMLAKISTQAVAFAKLADSTASAVFDLSRKPLFVTGRGRSLLMLSTCWARKNEFDLSQVKSIFKFKFYHSFQVILLILISIKINTYFINWWTGNFCYVIQNFRKNNRFMFKRIKKDSKVFSDSFQILLE